MLNNCVKHKGFVDNKLAKCNNKWKQGEEIILEEDDILLILGKGHETYQIIKDKKIHFDDKEIVLSYLNMI